MEPHTIIQVTPATPSSTDSSKTNASNMLENLLDELQTFAKQSSIDSPSGITKSGSFRNTTKSSTFLHNTDTVTRKGDNVTNERSTEVTTQQMPVDYSSALIKESSL